MLFWGFFPSIIELTNEHHFFLDQYIFELASCLDLKQKRCLFMNERNKMTKENLFSSLYSCFFVFGWDCCWCYLMMVSTTMMMMMNSLNLHFSLKIIVVNKSIRFCYLVMCIKYHTITSRDTKIQNTKLVICTNIVLADFFFLLVRSLSFCCRQHYSYAKWIWHGKILFMLFNFPGIEISLWIFLI